jgi:hypothetical protein
MKRKDPRLLELILSPYKRKLKSERILPTKSLDIFQVYRVVQENPDGTKSDVFLPLKLVTGSGAKRKHTTTLVCQLFCVGLEFELERYLRWLDGSALVNTNGESPTLHVGVQPTYEALEAIQHLNHFAQSSGLNSVVYTHNSSDDVFLHAPWTSIPLDRTSKRQEWLIY